MIYLFTLQESLTLIKGGEILIILRKKELDNIWPRLLESTEKVRI